MSIAKLQGPPKGHNGGYDPTRTGAARALKAGDLLARQHVLAYQGLPDGVSHPFELLKAVKDAFPRLTLTPKAMALYDYLFGLTGKYDWHKDRLALVWPSNDQIMSALAISDVSQLKKLFRQLRALGLIDYKDSPTRKRYGRRHPSGLIDYPNSFGIVLNSVAGLYADFKRLAESVVIEQRYRREVRRAVTAARRERDDLILAAEDLLDATAVDARLAVFDGIDTQLAETGRDYRAKEALIERYRTALDMLKSELSEAAASRPAEWHETDHDELERMKAYSAPESKIKPPTGGQKHPSNRSITAPAPARGNRLSDMSSAPTDLVSPVPSEPEAKSDRQTSGGALGRQMAKIKALEAAADDAKAGHRFDQATISLSQVRAALPPAVAVGIGNDWGFYEIFDHVRDALDREGISPLVLDDARLLMGHERACACAAVILAKRSQLRNAENYLRGMMTKYRDGALRVERSLFGIIAERKKRIPETRKLGL